MLKCSGIGVVLWFENFYLSISCVLKRFIEKCILKVYGKVVCVCLLLCSMYLRCVVLLLFIVEIIFQVLRCAKLCCGRVFLGGGCVVCGGQCCV